MFMVFLCPGTPEGSTGSGSGFKASQKTGKWLKVSSDRLGEAGNRTCKPWFTRHRFIPYTFFCGFLGYKPVPPGWFKIVCWFYVGNTQRLTESCFFMEKPGIEPVTPGLQGIALIPYTKQTFLWLSWV